MITDRKRANGEKSWRPYTACCSDAREHGWSAVVTLAVLTVETHHGNGRCTTHRTALPAAPQHPYSPERIPSLTTWLDARLKCHLVHLLYVKWNETCSIGLDEQSEISPLRGQKMSLIFLCLPLRWQEKVGSPQWCWSIKARDLPSPQNPGSNEY